MTAVMTGPLSYGQLSVWRDVECFPPEKRYQANIVQALELGPDFPVSRVRAAVEVLRARHESLRTVYDFTDPALPRQIVRALGASDLVLREIVPLDGEDSAAAVARVVNEMDTESFDLTTEESLRLAVLAVAGEPTQVVFALHHIAADLWALDVLRAEFERLLHGHDMPASTISPCELAVSQHSAKWAARRDAAATHLRHVFTAAAETTAVDIVIAPGPTARANLASRIARSRAGARAEELGISVPSLVLAAYCHQAHEVAGAPDILVNTMSTNRLHPTTATLVTSMNQWARMVSHRAEGQSFADFARALHWTSQRAYRYGCYDVDVDVRIRGEVESTVGPIRPEFSFNYVQVESGEVRPADAPEWEVSPLPAITVGGPNFYLVATEGPEFELTARTRWTSFGEPEMAEFLTAVHSLLI
ncbi:condensation domain-containing protein [Actinokineospora sp.]|uniref:condensation domain-containing protein n=1 Tax=Actinokineospora sp. TaxID=1872133 RepID=UPI004037BA76